MFKNNKIVKVLEPGLHKFIFINLAEYRFAVFDSTVRLVHLSNQEIMAKDQVAFRIGFLVEYIITDFEKVSEFIDFSASGHNPTHYSGSLDTRVYYEVQVEMNSKMAQIESDVVFSDYKKLNATEQEIANINSHLSGLKVKSVRIKDTSFPKSVQEIFAKKLETKIRAQTELENARTTVAAARALNNAAAMLNENPGMEFLIYMDTLKNIAAKGKHTFFIGKDEAISRDTK